jgi:osmotically-inducible protein OsmY
VEVLIAMANEFDRDVDANPSYRKNFGDLPGQVPQRGDEDIRRDIESIIFYDDLVRAYEIKIDVNQGVVTLSGTVRTDMERRRAEEDASRAHGVKQVINNIELSQEVGR